MSGNCGHLQDFLFNGLPCVWNGREYIVFSPYSLKIARIEGVQINSIETERMLTREGFFGQPVRPQKSFSTAHFGLVLTTGCNLRCKYCYVVPKTEPRVMNPKYAIRIIQEKITYDTEKISLSFFGGEPTLNMTTLKAVVEYIKQLERPYQFLINTNGTMDEKDLDYLIANKFIFSVSSDGIPSITDSQRPTLDDSSVSVLIERTIKKLVATNSIFQVRPTITAFNVSKMLEAMQYWDELGVKFVHIEPII